MPCTFARIAQHYGRGPLRGSVDRVCVGVLCGGPIDFQAHVKAAREKPPFSTATHHLRRSPPSTSREPACSLLRRRRRLRSSSTPAARVPREDANIADIFRFASLQVLFMLSITLSRFWPPPPSSPSPPAGRAKKSFHIAINVSSRRNSAMRARDHYRTGSHHTDSRVKKR